MAGTGRKGRLGAIVVGVVLGLAGLVPQAAQAETRSECGDRRASCGNSDRSQPCQGCYQRERRCSDCYQDAPCRDARQPSCPDCYEDRAERPCRDCYYDDTEPCDDCYEDDDRRDDRKTGDDGRKGSGEEKKSDDYDDAKRSDEKKKGDDDGKDSDKDRSRLRKLLPGGQDR